VSNADPKTRDPATFENAKSLPAIAIRDAEKEGGDKGASALRNAALAISLITAVVDIC
jgi:hypothetical protein